MEFLVGFLMLYVVLTVCGCVYPFVEKSDFFGPHTGRSGD